MPIDFNSYPFVLPKIVPSNGAKPIKVTTPCGEFTFPSGREAARKLKCREDTIRLYRHRGGIFRGVAGRPPKAVKIGPHTFNCQQEAADAFHVSRQRISQIIKIGRWRGMTVEDLS